MSKYSVKLNREQREQLEELVKDDASFSSSLSEGSLSLHQGGGEGPCLELK